MVATASADYAVADFAVVAAVDVDFAAAALAEAEQMKYFADLVVIDEAQLFGMGPYSALDFALRYVPSLVGFAPPFADLWAAALPNAVADA